MSSTIGNGHRGGSSGRGDGPGNELEQLIGQGQERLKQIMPGGGPRSVIIAAIVAALLVGAWTAYYTVPSDSVAVVQRFGKYLEEAIKARSSFQGSSRHRRGHHRSGQAAIKARVRLHNARAPRTPTKARLTVNAKRKDGDR